MSRLSEPLRWRPSSRPPLHLSIASINTGQLVTPIDRMLVLGRLRKFDDRRRHPTAPVPDMERTEVIRRDLAGRRYFVFAALAAILGAVFELAFLLAASVASHT